MAADTLNVRPEYLDRLKSILSDSFYKDAMEHAASYNTRLCLERKMRLPFLDQQTGVAQSDCALWMHKWQRMPGQSEGQLYSYPARRWKKKRRQYLMNNFYLTRRMKEVENNESESHQSVNENSMSATQETDGGGGGTGGGGGGGGGGATDKIAEDSKDSWYKDFEETTEQFDMGEVEDPDTDVEDYEETYTVRKKKKKIRSSRGRKRADRYDYTDLEKPYVCETPRPTSEKSGTLPSTYCDFCLGDNNENKKTRMPEELVSCSDCGRSAHPTCLQFTPNMTTSVKKYRWQCIECKSCGICGTSDNDDQLLFCDDCDRGYHMYCLTPPLSEPPEGSWSCHLCIEEYGRK